MSENGTRDRDLSHIKQALFGEERRLLLEIRDLLALHHDRIGTDERLRRSVAQIIAKALRDAGSQQHDELAAAITPLIIAAVKREILNSRDELIDAMHPMLGHMVSAYVTNAIREFFYGADRRLESIFSPALWGLRVKSLFTGIPINELMLRQKKLVRIEEILLLKQSGILVDRWQAAPSGNTDDASSKRDGLLLSSLISAISTFAREAFADSKSELRCLDVGNARIYLRASPAHLVAIKCTGLITADTEKKIDRDVLDSLARYTFALSQATGEQETPALKHMLPDLANRLAQSLAPVMHDNVLQRHRPVYALTALVLLLLTGFTSVGHVILGERAARAKQYELESVVAANPDFQGYPVTISPAYDGRGYVVTGIAPSPQAAAELTQQIQGKAGLVPVTVNLVSGLLTTTTDTATGAVKTVTTLVGNTVDTVGQTVSRTLESVQTLTGRVLDLERTVATAARDGSLVKLPPAVAELPQKLVDTESRILTAVNTRLVDDLSNRVQALTGQVKEVSNGLGNAAPALTQKLNADLTSLTAQLADLGQRLNVKPGSPVKPVAPAEINGLITKVAEAERNVTLLPVRRQVDDLTTRVKEIVSRLGGGPNGNGLLRLNGRQGNEPKAFEIKNFEIFDIKDNYDLPLPSQNSGYSSEAAVRYMASRLRPNPLAQPGLITNGQPGVFGTAPGGVSGGNQNLVSGLGSTVQNTIGGVASTTQSLTTGLGNTTQNLIGGVTGTVNNVVNGLSGKK